MMPYVMVKSMQQSQMDESSERPHGSLSMEPPDPIGENCSSPHNAFHLSSWEETGSWQSKFSAPWTKNTHMNHMCIWHYWALIPLPRAKGLVGNFYNRD
jgi:hypothetical protein